MGNPLRDRRPLAELAARSQVIEISEKIGNFGGLARIVEDDLSTLDADKLPRDWRESPVSGRLGFRFLDAQQRLVAVEGELKATLDAVCQRCLEPFRLDVDVMLKLLPSVDGSTAAVADGFEVWDVDDESIRPAEIVEEALIMALPLSAMHASAEQCSAIAVTDGSAERKTRPFAGLRTVLDENH